MKNEIISLKKNLYRSTAIMFIVQLFGALGAGFFFVVQNVCRNNLLTHLYFKAVALVIAGAVNNLESKSSVCSSVAGIPFVKPVYESTSDTVAVMAFIKLASVVSHRVEPFLFRKTLFDESRI